MNSREYITLAAGGERVATMSVARETVFSYSRKYRYCLYREWGAPTVLEKLSAKSEEFVLFVGLNPSTADETKDDPTIRCCRGFATRWGYRAMFMANLFAIRATDPAVMKQCIDPVGYENDALLSTLAREASMVVVAWGNHGTHMERDVEVTKIINRDSRLIGPYCFGVTLSGQPKHPLRQPYSTQMTTYIRRYL